MWNFHPTLIPEKFAFFGKCGLNVMLNVPSFQVNFIIVFLTKEWFNVLIEDSDGRM